MRLKFDANQDFQLDAINASVDLFKGQPAGASDFAFSKASAVGGTFLSVVANNLILDDETILKNLQSVQKASDIEQSQSLDGFHFSIEMETGTGKTYVYLRTIHELHKHYGFKKFIIVVPSLAIKEGVLKNLDITKEHFDMLYEKPVMNSFEFDPKKRSLSKNFATTNSLQIMVMNIRVNRGKSIGGHLTYFSLSLKGISKSGIKGIWVISGDTIHIYCRYKLWTAFVIYDFRFAIYPVRWRLHLSHGVNDLLLTTEWIAKLDIKSTAKSQMLKF